MIALEIILGGVVLVWLGALLRAFRSKVDGGQQLGPQSPQVDSGQGIAVVIPARNESAHIEHCLSGVLSSPLDGIRIYVLDDGSTDGTGEVLARIAAAEDSVQVLRGADEAPPEGWLGKPWACQRAAEAAVASQPELRWLLFIDADVRLTAEAIGVAVAAAEAEEADLLSALGNLELQSFWERVFQPVVAGLILAGNDLAKVNNDVHPEGSAPLANGQFMLLRRSAWEELGGHGAVANNVLDDVGLASAVVQRGLRYRLYYAASLFRVRMYDSLPAMWAGWSKNLFAGLGYRWGRLVGVLLMLGVTVLLPWIALALGAAGWISPLGACIALAGVVAMLGVRLYVDASFGQQLRYAPTLPVGAVLLFMLLINSALQTRWGRREWKGRVLDSTQGGS